MTVRRKHWDPTGRAPKKKTPEIFEYTPGRVVIFEPWGGLPLVREHHTRIHIEIHNDAEPITFPIAGLEVSDA